MSRHPARSRWGLWVAVLAVAVVVAGLIPLLFNRSYYYAADTSQGSYGNWFILGSDLRDGVWPMVNPSAWASGNYIAEGQMGLFSPLTILIALGSTFASNVVVYTTAVKIGLLVVGALGVQALLRSWSVAPGLATAGGLLAALGGFTQYMDAPSWTTNLMIWAIFPWVWWGFRRITDGRSPWLALVAGYLLVTVGYVHGTIMLVVLVCAVAIEALVTSRRAGALKVVGAGLLLGLVALAVYLPGVLTAEVTDRGEMLVENTGFMVVDLTGLASSAIPSALPQITGWWGTFAPGPLLYTAWALPLLALVDPARVRQSWRQLVALAIVGVFALLFVLGPSDAGPLRYPARLMPFVTTAIVIALILVLDRLRKPELSVARRVAVVALVLGSGYLAFAQRPETVLVHVAATAGVTVLVLAVMWVLGRPERVRAVGAVMVVGALGVTLFQHRIFDGRETSSANDYPDELAEYQEVVPDGVNDGIVIGDPSSLTTDELFDVTLVANAWYLNDNVAMQNVYTTIFFSAYSSQMCMNHVGATCPELISTLFTDEADDAGAPPLVDLLAIDTVQIMNDSGALEIMPDPPAGWHVADQDSLTTLWLRDVPVGPAGSATWSDSDVEFEVDDSGRNATSFTLLEDGRGDVVISRLAWPGYRTTAGTITEPLDGYLLTVDVDGLAAGTTIEVQYRPPLWEVGIGAVVIAVLVGAAWCVVHAVRSGRRADTDPTA